MSVQTLHKNVGWKFDWLTCQIDTSTRITRKGTLSGIILPLKMDKLSNVCTPSLPLLTWSHADTVFFSVSSFLRRLGKTTQEQFVSLFRSETWKLAEMDWSTSSESRFALKYSWGELNKTKFRNRWNSNWKWSWLPNATTLYIHAEFTKTLWHGN